MVKYYCSMYKPSYCTVVTWNPKCLARFWSYHKSWITGISLGNSNKTVTKIALESILPRYSCTLGYPL